MWLYLLLLAASANLVVLLHTCSLRPAAHRLRAQGGSDGDTLDVALLYGPASYYIYGDTLGGYNYDLLRLLSQRENIPMKFWPVGGLKEGLRQLQAGKYDVLATLPVDADYKNRYLYSTPLYLDSQVLVQRTDGRRADSALDLAGDTVHIEKDSPIAARLANLSREIGDSIHVVEHADLSAELLVLAVQRGDLRYAVVNRQVALPLTERFDNLDISSPISFTQFQALVLAPSDTLLLHRLNKTLEPLLKSPEAQTLRQRYHLD